VTLGRTARLERCKSLRSAFHIEFALIAVSIVYRHKSHLDGIGSMYKSCGNENMYWCHHAVRT
jgi:hypothetical protein